MSSGLSVLEKQIEDLELLLLGGLNASDLNVDLVTRFNKLKDILKQRCQNGDLANELLTRPVDQLKNLLGVLNNTTDSQLSDKVRSINAQQGLINQRLELMNEASSLKERLNTNAMKSSLELKDNLSKCGAELRRMENLFSESSAHTCEEQTLLDEMFQVVDDQISRLSK